MSRGFRLSGEQNDRFVLYLPDDAGLLIVRSKDLEGLYEILHNRFKPQELKNCPKCGSNDLSVDSLDHTTFAREVSCKNCDNIWVEFFAYVGMEEG